MICVNWYLKISILQVQFYHPVLWLDEVGESVETLHFEMLVFHIESLQVYDRSLSPLLFFPLGRFVIQSFLGRVRSLSLHLWTVIL